MTPAYNVSGNMTTMPQPAAPTSSFTGIYDAWNRMTEVDSGGSPVGQYQYDGRHRRIVAATTQTRHFYFTNDWQDVEQRVGSATTMDQQHVWGIRYIDELICRDDATPARLYATQDAIFSVTALTDTSGVPKQYMTYDPYGTDHIFDGAWTSAADAFDWVCRFTGRKYDLETGGYSYRMRQYLPHLAVFVSRDPIILNGDISLYQYVGSTPLVLVDPFGLQAEPAARAETETRKIDDCTVEVALADEGYWKTHRLTTPNACSSYGILGCYANVFNREPDANGNPGNPHEGVIANFPSIRGPIGTGQIADAAPNYPGYKLANDPSLPTKNPDDAAKNRYAYNGGRGVAPGRNDDKNFHDLFADAMNRALDQARQNCTGKCGCQTVTVVFTCHDPQSEAWGQQLFTHHQQDWVNKGDPKSRWQKATPAATTLCGMSKVIRC